MPRPFRADQVGSLLRPPALLCARDAHARGELSKTALAELVAADNAASTVWRVTA
jgi:5-methyltetrahydropteroyltriglutamate--homocysteine methyltransferase